MQYRFKGFQFDCQDLLLIKGDKVVNLNEKSLQLLSCFIHQHDKILSKEAILEAVWPDRVVTEQVVFQNISQLRAILGDDAIRTFSKRGYQWQLPLEQVTYSEECSNKPNDSVPSNNARSNAKGYKAVIAIVVLVLLSVSIWHFSYATSAKKLNQHVYIVEKKDSYGSLQLSDGKALTDIAVQTLFDSPFHTWQKTTAEPNQLLVGSRWYPLVKGGVLRFHIQGEKRGWHDYIESNSHSEAMEKLSYLVSKVAPTYYFKHENRYQNMAELALLSDKPFLNLLIARQEVMLLTQLKDLQRARAITEQQLANTSSSFQRGLLLLAQVEIDQHDDYWDEAIKNIEYAIDIFEGLDLPHLQAQALMKSSWGHLVNKTFLIGMEVLNKASSIARSSNEPLLEVNTRLIQSFMASKTKRPDLMHTQLNLAKELIKLHQLPEEHNIRLAYNTAWAASTEAQALESYRFILNQPYSQQYEVLFYSAAEAVLDVTIKQQSWVMASQSIKPWQRLSFQQLAKAKIAYAQKHWQEAESFAVQAFQEASVTTERIDALDAALIVLTINRENMRTMQTYQYYIEQQATRRWNRINKQALIALGFVHETRLN